jgi:hypothetical protein
MARNPADQRTRQWIQQPGQAIPYRLPARVGDWWCAVRDARVGAADLLVSVDADAAGAPRIDLGSRDPVPDTTAVWATPRTVYLGRLGRGRSEREWVQYEADVADDLVELRKAQQQRDSARERLASAERRLAELAPPTGEDLAARRTGEERTDPAVVADRRRREYIRRREPLEAEVDALRSKGGGVRRRDRPAGGVGPDQARGDADPQRHDRRLHPSPVRRLCHQAGPSAPDGQADRPPDPLGLAGAGLRARS